MYSAPISSETIDTMNGTMIVRTLDELAESGAKNVEKILAEAWQLTLAGKHHEAAAKRAEAAPLADAVADIRRCL